VSCREGSVVVIIVVVGSALGTAWGKYAWDSYLVVAKMSCRGMPVRIYLPRFKCMGSIVFSTWDFARVMGTNKKQDVVWCVVEYSVESEPVPC